MDEKKINKKLYDKMSAKISEDLKNSLDDPRLVDLTPIGEFPPDIQSILFALYNNPDPRAKRFGSVLNSIFTHANGVFVLTQRLCAGLVEKDVHYTQKSTDSISYKKMLGFALQNCYLNVLRSPVQNSKGVMGKAGLYELADEDFLAPLIEMIGITNLKANKDQKLKWYDENNTPEVQENPSPEIIAERTRLRKLASELRKQRDEP
jgi:hypothetical protein